MKSRKYTKNHIEQILYVLLGIFIIFFLILAIPLIMAYFEETPKNMEEIIISCQNLNLKDSGKCVIDITDNFYKYNLENVGKNLNFNELKEQGGVCSNWSEYYSELGNKLGFNTRNIIIPTSNDLYHAFSVWSSDNGYCVLDQIKISCIELQ